MKTIYLTGFMGAGKTTIGRELSKHLSIPVIDSDLEIEKKKQKTIRSIFDQEGEAVFRNLETEILRQIPTTDMIVTTGGGIVIKEENRKWMKDHGLLIYLHCDFDVIWERLEQDTTRPLVVNKEQTQNLYQSRMPFYLDHHIMIDTSLLTIDQIVVELTEKVKIAGK